jgi:uncharacterized membrane protein YeiB
MAFLLVGMWLGRLDLRERRIRVPVLWIALVVTAIAEAIDSVATMSPEWLGLDEASATWLLAWPRPPHVVYMVAATGLAVAIVCICISVTENRPDASWVVALVATGQLAFTLYIAHAIAIVIPLQHGLLAGGSLELSVAYSLAFYLGAVALSWWWRRRFPQGPLEALIRQITGRTSPAPWGGQLAGAAKE